MTSSRETSPRVTSSRPTPRRARKEPSTRPPQLCWHYPRHPSTTRTTRTPTPTRRIPTIHSPTPPIASYCEPPPPPRWLRSRACSDGGTKTTAVGMHLSSIRTIRARWTRSTWTSRTWIPTPAAGDGSRPATWSKSPDPNGERGRTTERGSLSGESGQRPTRSRRRRGARMTRRRPPPSRTPTNPRTPTRRTNPNPSGWTRAPSPPPRGRLIAGRFPRARYPAASTPRVYSRLSRYWTIYSRRCPSPTPRTWASRWRRWRLSRRTRTLVNF